MPWSFLAGYDGRLRDVRTAAAIIESRWVQARQVLHVSLQINSMSSFASCSGK
jgi:hypothetical protein